MEQVKKNIEIITGNSEDLNISPVSSHLPISKPKMKENSNEKIVIPTEKKKRRKQ